MLRPRGAARGEGVEAPRNVIPEQYSNESPVEAADAVNRLDDSRTGREPPELATSGTVDGYE